MTFPSDWPIRALVSFLGLTMIVGCGVKGWKGWGKKR